MKPYYQDSHVTIYHGDCREILPELPKVDLVLTDPPYGMKWDGRVTKGRDGDSFKRKGQVTSNYGVTIIGDDKPFDPSPFLDYPEVILWGFHHYSSRLPEGSVLIWNKRYETGYGSFLSDADLAWMQSGCGVYIFRDLSLQGESCYRYHPTQKPVPLMKWCITKAGSVDLILDPYMGSGTTLVAAKQMGKHSIGIEIEEKYCEIAAKRCMQTVMNLEIPKEIIKQEVLI